MSLKVTRYDLVQHGRVLATRPKGREVGQAASQQLSESGRLLLSFWEVDVASPAFLDELIRALRAVLLSDDRPWLLVVAGVNDDVKESLELVLAKQKMGLATLDGDQVRLLGGTRQLSETLREAQRMGEFTAPELAERLRIKLPALHQRLNALMQAGALAREDDPTAERGRRGKYSAPQGDELSGASKPSVKEVEAVTTA